VRQSRVLCLAIVLLCLGAAACGTESRRRPPHIVLIVSDSLRASSLSLYGYDRDTTPFLSELARDAIVFEHHLANYPATPFSVSQMLSGRVMSPLLMNFTPNRVPVQTLEPDLLVLPRELQQRGYRTGLVTAHPWFGKGARIRQHFESVAVRTQATGAYASFASLLPDIEQFLREAETDERPFFLYVHSMDTHTPMRFHDGFDAHRDATDRPDEINAYDSEIEFTDHHVGLLLQSLREAELLEDTIFIFTSDHGEQFGESGQAWWQRGHGATLHRALLHVPLLMRLPGGVHAGRRAGLSRHVDLAPTLLRLVDPEASLDAFDLDGRDSSGELTGKARVAPLRGSFSFTWLYWAWHDRRTETHYDQWSRRTTHYRVTRGPANAAALVEFEPDDAATREAELKEHMREAAERLAARKAPAADEAVLVGLPTTVDHTQGRAPTLRRSPTDNRWHLASPTLLEARAGESPGPIVLTMPWIPGRYEVAVRLSPRQAKRGYANRFRVEFLGPESTAIEVDGRAIQAPFRIPIGEQQLSRTLAVRISEPRGNVAISGFWLRPVGATQSAQPALEPALERQLRALGYLE
jgi:arylsulfatase A-like enzyme